MADCKSTNDPMLHNFLNAIKKPKDKGSNRNESALIEAVRDTVKYKKCPEHSDLGRGHVEIIQPTKSSLKK